MREALTSAGVSIGGGGGAKITSTTTTMTLGGGGGGRGGSGAGGGGVRYTRADFPVKHENKLKQTFQNHRGFFLVFVRGGGREGEGSPRGHGGHEDKEEAGGGNKEEEES